MGIYIFVYVVFTNYMEGSYEKASGVSEKHVLQSRVREDRPQQGCEWGLSSLSTWKKYFQIFCALCKRKRSWISHSITQQVSGLTKLSTKGISKAPEEYNIETYIQGSTSTAAMLLENFTSNNSISPNIKILTKTPII